ncbi:hypothetical protein SNE40_020936 [Patella caerulea]|uniref:Major facilitator superfamily (MFS) profile domain-containing protein n=1 Tax=Patella caerulea TaxID=87958 RepID=A0AAN8IYT2_PATCE
MKINTKLISLKAFFFCNYAAAGALLPFLTVHLKKVGINSTEAGLIAGLTQLLSIFIRPASGAFADKQNKHKTILLLMLVLYGTSYFSLMLVPYRHDFTSNQPVFTFRNLSQNVTVILSSLNASFSCGAIDGQSYKRKIKNMCGEVIRIEADCGVNCSLPVCSDLCCQLDDPSVVSDFQFNPSQNDTRNCTVPYDNSELVEWRFDITFILSFLLVLIARISYSCLQSLLDTITYFMLGTNRLLYSRQRLWGTAGTAISASCVIFVIDTYYDGVFYLFGGFCLLAFFVGLTLDVQAEKRENVKLVDILKQQIVLPYIRWFLIKILFYGMFLGATINFLFWFFKDIGVSGSFLGIITLVHCVSSLFVLQLAPKLLKTFGQDMCMYAAICVYSIRFVGHSFVPNQWIIIPLELLRGISYALFWAAASSKVSLLAPSGSQGTFQGLAGAVYNDLGRGLGSIVTGFLFQQFSARWTFRAYAVLCVILLVISCFFDRRWKTPIKSQKETKIKMNTDTSEHLLTEKPVDV